MSKPMQGLMKTKSFDNLCTPENAVKILLPFIPDDVKWVWECSDPGNSIISSVLRESNYKVMSSDIQTGNNFLDDENDENFCDVIITNPPFSKKTQFLKKCYELGKPFALLLPLTSIGGQERNELFSKYGISLIIPDKRIDFTGKNAPWFAVAWFTYGFKNKPLEFVKL